MKLTVALVSKLFFLAYIILSPIIDHSVLLFLNNAACKVIILITIVAVSFLDMQVSILLMIVFLILLINFNRIDISRLNIVSDTKRYIQDMNDIFQELIPEPEPVVMSSSKDFHAFGGQMLELIEPYFDTNVYQEVIDVDSLEEKIKPYEQYVKALSPMNSLSTIQSNEVTS